MAGRWFVAYESFQWPGYCQEIPGNRREYLYYDQPDDPDPKFYSYDSDYPSLEEKVRKKNGGERFSIRDWILI